MEKLKSCVRAHRHACTERWGSLGGGLQEKINTGVKETKVFESFSPQGLNQFYLHLQLGATTVKSRKAFGDTVLVPLALRGWAGDVWQRPPRHIPSRKEYGSVCKAEGCLHTALSVGNSAQV